MKPIRPRTLVALASALLAAALPVSGPYAWAGGGPTSMIRTVTQEPGHPLLLYPGKEGTAAAVCPQGTKPTGGGAKVGNDSLAAVFFKESAPNLVRNSWQVRVYNSTNEVQTVHPRAVCSTDSTITYDVGRDSSIQPGDFNSASAGCDYPRYAVGGGVQAGPRSFVVWSGSANIRAWTVAAKYTDYSPEAPDSYVRALAVCSDSEPSFKTVKVILAAGEVGTAHAECPAGQVPVGGGGLGGLDVLLTTTIPTDTGWTARAKNRSSDQRALFADVLCTTP
ncbi:hypothetical protein ACFXDJ_10550 [Streptomyces sp. NPDC059443]|uniref:hypothetical protein n=1 Tax=unclassified Streptomyces TaxID=2593676 RepID=UPI0036B14CC0